MEFSFNINADTYVSVSITSEDGQFSYEADVDSDRWSTLAEDDVVATVEQKVAQYMASAVATNYEVGVEESFRSGSSLIIRGTLTAKQPVAS